MISDEKKMLELAWNKDIEKFDYYADEPPKCLRCGRTLNSKFKHNTPSRYANIFICPYCEYDETEREEEDDPLPLLL